jgi:hypothetical protein
LFEDLNLHLHHLNVKLLFSNIYYLFVDAMLLWCRIRITQTNQGIYKMITISDILRAKRLTTEQFQAAISTCVAAIQDDAIKLLAIKNFLLGKRKFADFEGDNFVYRVKSLETCHVVCDVNDNILRVEW